MTKSRSRPSRRAPIMQGDVRTVGAGRTVGNASAAVTYICNVRG